MRDDGGSAEQRHDSAAQEPPGHHWREPERVQQFAARMDRQESERRERLSLLARLLPYRNDEPIRVLDVGAGYGAVAAAVLAVFPRAEAELLDVSEAMIELGRERMAPFEGRYRYVHGDFAGGLLPETAPGPYHAIVSALAIHHLPPDRKRSLYRDLASRLRPGGCFLNFDIVAPPEAALEPLYRRIEEEDRRARGEPPPAIAPRVHHSELQPLADHLGWLREAGFVSVDVFWKRMGYALFGGFVP